MEVPAHPEHESKQAFRNIDTDKITTGTSSQMNRVIYYFLCAVYVRHQTLFFVCDATNIHDNPQYATAPCLRAPMGAVRYEYK